MSIKRIQDGDVLTFTAVKWDETNWEIKRPAMLLSPVAHIYEDGIDLDTVIYEALLDASATGILRDMETKVFLSERGWNLRFLKHVVKLFGKRKASAGKNYHIVKETYRFIKDDGGFQYENLSNNHQQLILV
jgi:hypothetical protein